MEESVLFNYNYLSFSNNWKPCHGAINSRRHNLRTALVKYFRFHLNWKQLRVEVTYSMQNSEIYFLLFSKATCTILKTFSQRSLRWRYEIIACKNFWQKVFDEVASASMSLITNVLVTVIFCVFLFPRDTHCSVPFTELLLSRSACNMIFLTVYFAMS